jgi:hypothetical protein
MFAHMGAVVILTSPHIWNLMYGYTNTNFIRNPVSFSGGVGMGGHKSLKLTQAHELCIVCSYLYKYKIIYV